MPFARDESIASAPFRAHWQWRAIHSARCRSPRCSTANLSLPLHPKCWNAALNESTRLGDSAPFIEFMLARLLDAIAAAGNPGKPRRNPPKTPSETRLKTPVKTLVKTPVKTRVKTADQILALLREQPTLTLAEVAAHLGKSTSAIERAARKLRDDGCLCFTGPQKGGRWIVAP